MTKSWISTSSAAPMFQQQLDSVKSLTLSLSHYLNYDYLKNTTNLVTEAVVSKLNIITSSCSSLFPNIRQRFGNFILWTLVVSTSSAFVGLQLYKFWQQQQPEHQLKVFGFVARIRCFLIKIEKRKKVFGDMMSKNISNNSHYSASDTENINNNNTKLLHRHFLCAMREEIWHEYKAAGWLVNNYQATIPFYKRFFVSLPTSFLISFVVPFAFSKRSFLISFSLPEEYFIIQNLAMESLEAAVDELDEKYQCQLSSSSSSSSSFDKQLEQEEGGKNSNSNNQQQQQLSKQEQEETRVEHHHELLQLLVWAENKSSSSSAGNPSPKSIHRALTWKLTLRRFWLNRIFEIRGIQRAVKILVKLLFFRSSSNNNNSIISNNNSNTVVENVDDEEETAATLSSRQHQSLLETQQCDSPFYTDNNNNNSIDSNNSSSNSNSSSSVWSRFSNWVATSKVTHLQKWSFPLRFSLLVGSEITLFFFSRYVSKNIGKEGLNNTTFTQIRNTMPMAITLIEMLIREIFIYNLAMTIDIDALKMLSKKAAYYLSMADTGALEALAAKQQSRGGGFQPRSGRHRAAASGLDELGGDAGGDSSNYEIHLEKMRDLGTESIPCISGLVQFSVPTFLYSYELFSSLILPFFLKRQKEQQQQQEHQQRLVCFLVSIFWYCIDDVLIVNISKMLFVGPRAILQHVGDYLATKHHHDHHLHHHDSQQHNNSSEIGTENIDEEHIARNRFPLTIRNVNGTFLGSDLLLTVAVEKNKKNHNESNISNDNDNLKKENKQNALLTCLTFSNGSCAIFAEQSRLDAIDMLTTTTTNKSKFHSQYFIDDSITRYIVETIKYYQMKRLQKLERLEKQQKSKKVTISVSEQEEQKSNNSNNNKIIALNKNKIQPGFVQLDSEEETIITTIEPDSIPRVKFDRPSYQGEMISKSKFMLLRVLGMEVVSTLCGLELRRRWQFRKIIVEAGQNLLDPHSNLFLDILLLVRRHIAMHVAALMMEQQQQQQESSSTTSLTTTNNSFISTMFTTAFKAIGNVFTESYDHLYSSFFNNNSNNNTNNSKPKLLFLLLEILKQIKIIVFDKFPSLFIQLYETSSKALELQQQQQQQDNNDSSTTSSTSTALSQQLFTNEVEYHLDRFDFLDTRIFDTLKFFSQLENLHGYFAELTSTIDQERYSSDKNFPFEKGQSISIEFRNVSLNYRKLPGIRALSMFDNNNNSDNDDDDDDEGAGESDKDSINNNINDVFIEDEEEVDEEEEFEEIEETEEQTDDDVETEKEEEKQISTQKMLMKRDRRVLGVAIQNVSFTAKAGETLGVVGESGSGKSTILKLLLRLYDPTSTTNNNNNNNNESGNIFINGIDLKSIRDVRSWRRNGVAYVDQKPLIFEESTIRDNVEFGRALPREVVDEALRHANCNTFVETLPLGADTIIGNRLSSGERQRLVIARAFARRAPLLLLDEATSALDAESEGYVVQGCFENTKKFKTTTIVVAHRLATLKRADRILVMDKGSCVGLGTHEELIENCVYYKELYDRQKLMRGVEKRIIHQGNNNNNNTNNTEQNNDDEEEEEQQQEDEVEHFVTLSEIASIMPEDGDYSLKLQEKDLLLLTKALRSFQKPKIKSNNNKSSRIENENDEEPEAEEEQQEEETEELDETEETWCTDEDEDDNDDSPKQEEDNDNEDEDEDEEFCSELETILSMAKQYQEVEKQKQKQEQRELKRQSKSKCKKKRNK